MHRPIFSLSNLHLNIKFFLSSVESSSKCIITLDSQSSHCPSSDDGNTSNKSSFNSSGSRRTAEKLREYRVRKLKRLVDKCHKRKIVFPDCFVELSSCFAKDPSYLNDNEIIELIAECNQSLDSDKEENQSDSSSDLWRQASQKSEAARCVNSI